MGDIEPTGQTGGPGVLAAFELMLSKDDRFRPKALELLQQYPLPKAVEKAVEFLNERGKIVDAGHLESTVERFMAWPAEQQRKLTRVGLEVILEGNDVSFEHRAGPWAIRNLGGGCILVQGPRTFMCQGPDSPPDGDYPGDDDVTSPGDGPGTSPGDET
jgi:hypothetical protein